MAGRSKSRIASALLAATVSVGMNRAFVLAPSLYLNGLSFVPSRASTQYTFRRFLTTTLFAQMSAPRYFLMKSEPDEFSIQDLQACQEDEWDGVRNYQARNKMRLMREGDSAFFYHSSCKVPAIVGTMRVVREVAPDATALDPEHKGYDPKSTADNCHWDSVRVQFESMFDKPVTLQKLKEDSKSDRVIAEMTLLRQRRLSVHQITSEQWEKVMAASKADDHAEEFESKLPCPADLKASNSSDTKISLSSNRTLPAFPLNA